MQIVDEFELTDGLRFLHSTYSTYKKPYSSLSRVAPSLSILFSSVFREMWNTLRTKFLRILEVENNKNVRCLRPRRIRPLRIISITFCTSRRKVASKIRQKISLLVAPRVCWAQGSLRGINVPVRSRMSPRFPLPASLNRCTRRRSSRGPRSARSCCPPAAERDPCVRSGTPACGRDRRASIGISPWRARFDSAKASPADNRCARSAWLLAPSYPGTVLNLNGEHKVVRLLRWVSTMGSYRLMSSVQCFNKIQNGYFLRFLTGYLRLSLYVCNIGFF